MRRRAWSFVALALALVLLVAVVGRRCFFDRPTGETSGVVDVELLAFLSESRALHHEANLKEEAGDLSGAAMAMQRLVTLQRPNGERSATKTPEVPEVEEVLADAYARLAEIELRQGSIVPAAEAIRVGLTHAPEPTYFRGHLIEIEGLIEEARATALADAGKLEEAVRAREKAISHLEDVVRIQEQVIQRSWAARDATAEGGR